MSEPEMVTNPDGDTLKSDVVALPAAFVVEAMSKRLPRAPGVSWIASFAYGGKVVRVEVPICKRFAVLSQVKAASWERLVALVQKVTWFVAPLPVKLDEFEMRQVTFWA